MNKLKHIRVPDGERGQIKVQENVIQPLHHIIDKRPDYLILLLSLIPSSLGGYPTI